ncbi:MAG: MoaD/ThiS family protein [Planctomycetaceae bacterium]
MQLKLNLMGALKTKSPPDNRLETADAACINDVLAALEIADHQVQVVIVNGKPQPDRQRPLADGDELTVVAPVGGG